MENKMIPGLQQCQPTAIEKTDLDALRLIEAVNLLEQGDTLRQWPNISKVYRAQAGKRK